MAVILLIVSDVSCPLSSALQFSNFSIILYHIILSAILISFRPRPHFWNDASISSARGICPFIAWPEACIHNETKEVANDKERCATYFARDRPAAVRYTSNIQGYLYSQDTSCPKQLKRRDPPRNSPLDLSYTNEASQ